MAFDSRDRASFVRFAVLDVVLANPLHLDILLKLLRLQSFNLQPQVYSPYCCASSACRRL